RVRAMLGAIGEQIGQPGSVLAELREGLNPLSRFDFGILAALAYARRWLAKGWGLIQRFSEDIDIFLDPTGFEPPRQLDPLARSSRVRPLRHDPELGR